MPKQTVGEGDDILSVAYDAGLSADAVFAHPDNETLRNDQKRSKTILRRGDSVEVSEIDVTEESAPTEQKTTFKLDGVPAELNLILQRGGEPVANTRYLIKIDGVLREGTTDGNGKLTEKIFPNDKIAKLRLGDDKGEFVFHLGSLDPVNTARGVQQRLYNMGFDPGVPDGEFGENSRKAMNRFQDKNEIKKTQKPDQATQDKLEQLHGC